MPRPRWVAALKRTRDVSPCAGWTRPAASSWPGPPMSCGARSVRGVMASRWLDRPAVLVHGPGPSLERLSEQADRIQSMATRLLALSQLESGGLEVTSSRSSVAEAVEAAVRAMLPEPGHRLGRIEVRELLVLADPLLSTRSWPTCGQRLRYGGPNIPSGPIATTTGEPRGPRRRPGGPPALAGTCSSPCAGAGHA